MQHQKRNGKRSYDVAIAYRICPALADSASALPYVGNKYRLSEICLRSLKNSLTGVRAKIWVLLDGCPPEYADLFRKYFGRNDLVLIDLGGVGNVATFRRQIEVLLEQRDADVVYFAEDDYIYLPAQFRCMIDFLSEQEDVDFVSPYDHLDCYRLDLHRQPKWLRVHAGRHWRTAASTCLTFLTRRETLAKTETAFRNYSRRSLDCSMWLSLTKHRVFDPVSFGRYLIREPLSSKIILKAWIYCWRQILLGRKRTLWVPIPSIATHLDSRALAPNVNWRALIEEESVVRAEAARSPRRLATEVET